MNTRLRLIVLVALVAVFAAASVASALEKAPARWTGSESNDEWRGASTCSLAYYNLCAGWIWIYSGFGDGENFGTHFTSCCTSGEATNLLQLDLYFYTAAPASYGFTGSLEVYAADATPCPTGAAVMTQAHLPASGWNSFDYSGGGGVAVPSDFIVLYTVADGLGLGNPTGIAADNPTENANALCDSPGARTPHSYFWGTTLGPACPGSTMGDPNPSYDAEWLAAAVVECVVSVEESSWGEVKALYR